MIITADVAQKLANQTLKQSKKLEKTLIRQLRKVEKAIAHNARKGKTSMQYHCLHSEVYKILEKNGYIIQLYGNYDYEWIVIRWKAKT